MSGVYEGPSPWLHEGYAQGITEWNVTGTYMGASADKSVVVFREGEERDGGELVARDLHTGEEQWRTDAPQDCFRPIHGIAYCVYNFGDYFSLATIDYANGKSDELAEVKKDVGLSPEFIGVHKGQSVWALSFSAPGGEEIRELVAIDNRALQWRAPIVHNSICHSADGVIVCESQSGHNAVSLEVFSAVNGKKVSQFDDAQSVALFRDGLVVRQGASGYKKYSWTGEEMGAPPHVPDISARWPGKEDGVLLPISTLGHADVQAASHTGAPLLYGPKETPQEPHRFVDASSGIGVGGQTADSLVVASESGRLYLVEDKAAKAMILYSEEGKEISRIFYFESQPLLYQDGILYSQRKGANNFTVYAPKGK
ncbi:MAG: hypothetical protein Q4C87_01410 [Actinomycetaceae bacterium]|nr:hypothetical protein [Actinomycetaceae bacterium]